MVWVRRFRQWSFSRWGNVDAQGELVIEGDGTGEVSVQGNIASDGNDDFLIWFSNIQGSIDAIKKDTVEISHNEIIAKSLKIVETIGSAISDVGVIFFKNSITEGATIEKNSVDVAITSNEFGEKLEVKENQGDSTVVKDNTIEKDFVCEKNTNLDKADNTVSENGVDKCVD